jgi:hypothetical protein
MAFFFAQQYTQYSERQIYFFPKHTLSASQAANYELTKNSYFALSAGSNQNFL